MTKKYNLIGVQEDKSNNVDFAVSIDEDGDLLITANGIKVFYVNCASGKIRRFCVPNIIDQERSGVAFDSDHIEVEEN